MGKNCGISVDVQILHPEVTGSCILLVARFPDGKKTKIIVDAGLFQEPNYRHLNEQKFPFIPEEIEVVLVTHNHVDHQGRLAALCRQGYSNPIWTTEVTSAFMPLSLGDTYKILSCEANKNKKPLLYSNQDVTAAINQIEGYPYLKPIKLNERVTITFLENGHVFGASMILIQFHYLEIAPVNLLITGDYNSQNPFADIGSVPKSVTELPIHIICEATYGEKNRQQAVKYTFEDNILNALKANKTVIIPVFAFERGQRIASEIRHIQETHDLNFPVYADGKLFFQNTQKFLKAIEMGEVKEEMVNFLPENLKWVQEKSIRDSIKAESGAKVILATPGMACWNGASFDYIRKLLSNKNSLIQFTGYQCEGTFGRLLQDNYGKEIEIGGKPIQILADVQFSNEFSGHAKREELLKLITSFSNIKSILLNHGTYKAKEDMATYFYENGLQKLGILSRRIFYRLDAWGIQKSVATKFSE